jgi:hypothetical protein
MSDYRDVLSLHTHMRVFNAICDQSESIAQNRAPDWLVANLRRRIRKVQATGNKFIERHDRRVFGRDIPKQTADLLDDIDSVRIRPESGWDLPHSLYWRSVYYMYYLRGGLSLLPDYLLNRLWRMIRD